ncbi:MFS transporter [Litoribacter ruber]|uniref:MFS transporter n=1 Tax=Litoribacter ruber TaxID=702568 RepID=UPI001BD98BF1|nr:MFS transporter [Litoribacter ruber]MBT0810836.1 MFS transporter [Litoribacter ruber]
MDFVKKRRIALSSLFFLSGLCFASWATRIPEIQLKFSLSEAELGALLLGMPFGSLIALPLAGFMVHRFGSRIVLLLSGLCYGFFLVMIGLSDTLYTLAGVVVVFGMLGNIMNIALNTHAIEIEDLYQRNILGSFHGLWSLAGFTGAGIGGLTIYFGLPAFHHFLVVAAIVIAIVVFSQAYIIKERQSRGGSGMVLRRPDNLLLRVGLIGFFGMMCEGCMFDWSGVYFKKVVQIDPSYVAAGYVAFMAAMASGRFASDAIINRVGKVLTLKVSGILIGLGLSLAVIFPYVATSVIGFILVGFGTASVIPLSYSIAGRSKVFSPGVALSLVATISFFGFLLGPPLIGFIGELLNLRASFALIAFMGLCITLLMSIRREVFEGVG